MLKCSATLVVSRYGSKFLPRGRGGGGGEASEAESCRRSEAESHQRSESFAAGVFSGSNMHSSTFLILPSQICMLIPIRSRVRIGI